MTGGTAHRSFFKDSKALSVLEFAFVAPVFLLFIVFVFELALTLIIQNALNGAAREAGRFGIVENPQAAPGLTRAQAIDQRIKELAVDLSGGIIDPLQLSVQIYSYASLGNIQENEPFTDTNGDGIYNLPEPFVDENGNGSWDSGNATAGTGGQGQPVIYEISYPYTSVAPLFNMFLANIRLSGRTVIVNDLFLGG